MSGITDPSQEYFKDGLWAWVTDQWKKLIGDAAGHLQVDVVESGLPAGAASSANQTTMITALQLIDDLRAALTSVHTDSLDVRLDGQTADVEVKQTTAADLTPGIKGWDGTQWRKLALTWGYSGVVAELKSDTNADAGDNTLAGTVVPPGHVYVIENIAVTNLNKDLSRILVSATVLGIGVTLKEADPSAAAVYGWWNGRVTLSPGDNVFATFIGCDAGDDIYMMYCGYKMKIAE